MNNTHSTNHSKQLRAWAKIINDCKEAKASGTNVKDWLKANRLNVYNYLEFLIAELSPIAL